MVHTRGRERVAYIAVGGAFLDEPVNPATVVGMVLVVVGVVVLNLGAAH
jgi:multidrug transporter EmrE-like cation transporter